MKLVFRGASSAALILGLASGFQAAWAQQQTVTTAQPGQTAQTPAQVDQAAPGDQPAEAERVVITGSLIATTREDAPKPVEVYTRDELRDIGAPTVAEFVRDLSVSYDSNVGGPESSPGGGEVAGYAPANLRGLGDTGTLTLLNGRRLSTDNGFGADLNSIPSAALGAVEVLRDGASTTYGAGAVGGVINFTTRKDVNAPEIVIEKKMYDGSEGEFGVDFVTGWVGDTANLLFTYSYDKSEELRQFKRDYAMLPFTRNPEGYTQNNGSFTVLPSFYTPGPTNFALPGGTTGHLDPRRRIQDLSPAACGTLGGLPMQDIQPGAVQSTSSSRLDDNCAYGLHAFNNLVNEDETHRIFAEFNADITDNMEGTVSVLYTSLSTRGRDTPSEVPTNDAVIPYTYSGFLGARDDTTCQGACGYVIPTSVQTYTAAGVPTGAFVRNPFVDDFVTRAGSNPASFGAGTALYTGPGWRPFLFGGNPLFEGGRNENLTQRERFQVATEVSGEFTADGMFGFLDGINYTYSGQFTQNRNTTKSNQILTSRLHNALLGYGGAGCSAIDRVTTDYQTPPPQRSDFPAGFFGESPYQNALQQWRANFNRTVGIQSDTAPGANGCQFFNPFNSAFATSVISGASNPVYGGGAYENSRDLIEWLYHQRVNETTRESLIFDTVWSGQVPENLFALPGGEIGWAVGANWRQTERRNLPGASGDMLDVEIQRCAFPDPQFEINGESRKPVGEPDQFFGGAGCSGATPDGAFYTGSPNEPEYVDEQAIAYYAEVQLPILDNLNGSASWRREEFNGGRIKGDIYNVAAKYDVTDNLWVRASFGTNFRATADLNARPGTTEYAGTLQLGRFANTPIDFINTISTNLRPEDDKTLNVGVGYETDDLFGGRFSASADFFEIRIEDEVVSGDFLGGIALVTPALEAVFSNPNGSIPTSATQFDAAAADCSDPVAIFFVFNTPDGSCQPGTTGSDTVSFLTFTQNGTGFITNGIDYALSYRMPLFDGNFSFEARATQTLVYKEYGYEVLGVTLEPAASQLGLTGAFGDGSRSRELRGNGTLRWSNDRHMISLTGNYSTGSQERGYLACLPPYFDPATNTQLGLVGGGASCGTDLTTVFVDPATGDPIDDPTNGAAQFSDYGVDPGDRWTFDMTYIYRAPIWEELELRATIENIFDEDPVPSQSTLGYATGNPRGRVFELELTKRF